MENYYHLPEILINTTVNSDYFASTWYYFKCFTCISSFDLPMNPTKGGDC